MKSSKTNYYMSVLIFNKREEDSFYLLACSDNVVKIDAATDAVLLNVTGVWEAGTPGPDIRLISLYEPGDVYYIVGVLQTVAILRRDNFANIKQ